MKRTSDPTRDAIHKAIAYFADGSRGHSWTQVFQEERWPDGPTCPRCGSRDLGIVVARESHCCRDCGRVFSVWLGTVFARSRIDVALWMVVLWVEAKGEGWELAPAGEVSDRQLARAIGVKAKTARDMRRRIRKMAGGTDPAMGFDALLAACCPPWPRPGAADAGEPTTSLPPTTVPAAA